MTAQQKNKIILYIVFGSYIAFAVLEIVVAHTFRMLSILGVLGVIVVLSYPLGKWARDFRKLMESLPADHKYLTQHVAAIDINNIRTTWLGRYFLLEYPQKAMTSSRLISLQERILDLFNKYHLQDYSWCIISVR